MGSPFADSTDPYVLALNQAGIIYGSAAGGATYFLGESDITRAEFSAIVYRVMNYYQQNQATVPSDNIPATPNVDIPSVPSEPQTPVVSEPQALTITGVSSSKSASIIGSMYTVQFMLSASAKGGTGEYSYMFEILQNGTVTESNDWSSNNGISGTLSGNETCEVRVSVKDSSGATTSTIVDLLESSHF